MGQIEDIRSFVQIVEQESIGKAAEQAGIAKSAMSRKLRLLEERLETVLITRTTRQWSLTEAGRQYYERGLSVIHTVDEFEAHVRNEDLELRGEIRVSVPLYFGKTNLTAPLLEFSKKYPQVHLNVEFSDRTVDVIGEHFDLVVRITELQDSSLIARRLCQTRHLICASPEYLARSLEISEPGDIQQHRIIQFGSAKRPKWTFTSLGGKDIVVSLNASMNSHDGAFLIDAAEQGLGIVRVPDFMVSTSLSAGRLVEVLESYEVRPRGVYIVYPEARYLPHRTRALMEFLLARVVNEGKRVV